MKREVIDWLALVVLCGAGAGLGAYQNEAKGSGRIDPVSNAAQTAVLPVSTVIEGGLVTVGDWIAGVTNAGALASENRRLKQLSYTASLYDQTIEAMRRENENLQRLLGFPDFPDKSKVPARIIGYFPEDARVTITAGVRNGVRLGMPVVTADGLLGLVQAVSERTSQVALIWSPPPLKIGARLERDQPQAGLMSGESTGVVKLEFFDTSTPVEIGDTVVTSGFSQSIPGGIPIGEVSAVKVEEAYSKTTAYIKPFAKVGSLAEVLVLR